MPAIKEGELLSLLFSNGHLRFVPRQARIDQVALKDCEVHLARIKLIPRADLSVVLVFCAMFFVYCCAVSEGCLRGGFAVVLILFLLLSWSKPFRSLLVYSYRHLTPHLHTRMLRVCSTWRHPGHYGIQSDTV
jgi:hypothetical protein